MPPRAVIVGQGLAGTMLGWALERCGVDFEIVDAGLDGAASMVAAGLVNPITGQRLVKSWRIDELFPLAKAEYESLGVALERPVWRQVRIRRQFADDRERNVFTAKRARGELAEFVTESDDHGFTIDPAARVDLPALLAGSRERWRRDGRLREAKLAELGDRGAETVVIDCRGEGGTAGVFDFVPWKYSRGEIIQIEVGGLDPDTVVNDGHWVLPDGAGLAWVGATHDPGVRRNETTAAAGAALLRRAERLLGRPVQGRSHRAGVRVNLPDKRPVVGRHPLRAGVGIVNGLGAKGVLYAPWLAQQWADHLTVGAPFDPDVEVRRFWPPSAGRPT